MSTSRASTLESVDHRLISTVALCNIDLRLRRGMLSRSHRRSTAPQRLLALAHCSNSRARCLASLTPRPLPELALRPFEVERYPGWTDGSASLSSSETEPLSLAELLLHADADLAERWRALSLGYPSHNEGSPWLRREIASKYSTEAIDERHVNVCAPAEAIYLASRALLAADDHVVATVPLYQSLSEVARSMRCEVSAWRPSAGPPGAPYRFDPADLAALIRPGRTKLVVCNFPHNPTGALPTAAEFARVVAACEAAGCYLLVDEMYRGLEHGSREPLPAACEASAIGVSLSGLSKTVGLPGLRLGWLASRSPAVIQRVAQLKDYTTICPPAPSEVLGAVALRAQPALLERSRAIAAEGLAAARATVAKHPAALEWSEPAAGTFAFVGLKGGGGGGGSSEAYCEALRSRAGLMLMPGALFDLDATAADGSDAARRVRLTYGRADTATLLERWSEDIRRHGVTL